MSLNYSREDEFTCEICNSTFFSSIEVRDHKKSVHKIDIISQLLKETLKKFNCRVCNSLFTSASNRRRHETKLHNFCPKRELKLTYSCRICSSLFTTARSRRRHERNKHNFNPEIKQVLKCSECMQVFNTKQAIMTHLSNSHTNIVLKKENKEFKTMEEFKNWKLSVEKDTSSWFVFKRCNNYKEYSVKEYLCHRGGTFISKSKGKRHLKVSGSNKSGFFCPAIMIVREKLCVVNVTFISTHVGHLCEVDRLPLSVIRKNESAGLLPITDPISTNVEEIVQVPSTDTVNCDIEKRVIPDEIREVQESTNLKECAKAAILSFIPKLDEFTSDAQYREIIKQISELENHV